MTSERWDRASTVRDAVHVRGIPKYLTPSWVPSGQEPPSLIDGSVFRHVGHTQHAGYLV